MSLSFNEHEHQTPKSLKKKKKRYSVWPATFVCPAGLCFTSCSDVAVSGKNHYNKQIDIVMLKIHVTDSISEAWLLYPLTWHIDCGWWLCGCSGIQVSMKLPDAIFEGIFWEYVLNVIHTHPHFHSLIINRQSGYFFHSHQQFQGNETRQGNATSWF